MCEITISINDDGAMLSKEGEDRRISQARKWLSSIRDTVRYQAELEASAEAQFARADNLKAIDYSRDRVASSPNADAIPDAVACHMEIGEALKAVAEAASAQVKTAIAAIDALDDANWSRALSMYYIDSGDGTPAESWEHVCIKMHYSYGNIMKIQRRALLALYDHMPPTERGRVERAI